MDLNKLTENKPALIAFIIAGSFFALYAFTPIVVDKLSAQVIKKLERDYTPGPYYPGVDPDKVPSEVWGGNQPKPVFAKSLLNSVDAVALDGNWLKNWEAQRD